MEYYIPVQRQQQEIQNPLDNYARIMQIQHAQQQGQMNQLAYQKALREDQEQAAYNNYLASVDMSSPNALQQALPGMFKVAPKQAFALQKTIQEQTKSAADLEKVKAETVAKKLDYLKESFVPVNDQNTYESWLQRIAKDSPDIVATLPQKFSPEFKIDFMSKAEERAKQLYERANPKLHFSDVGGSIVGQNPFTAAVVGQGLSKTTTPGEMLTDWRAKNLPQQYGEILSTPVAAYNALAAQGVGGGAPVAPANALTWSGAAPVTWGQQRIPTEAAARAAMGNPTIEPRDTQAQALDVAGNIVAQREAARTGQAAPAMQAPAKAGGIPGIKLEQKEKPLPQNVVEQIQTTRTNADNLDKLTNTFKPDFASKGFFGFGADKSLEAKSVLGTDKDAVQWWKDYKKQAELVERHAMFGASLTPGEQASWRSADISPGMDADVIKRNLTERAALAKKVFANTTQDWIDAGHPAKQIQAIAGRSSSSGAGTRSVAGAISLDDYLKSKGH